ncbi:MAG: argonaute-like protein implicated in RNA metabolism and viral defense [Parasphingorhabdus sp.]|jgi:argonaute-like protein implicated in RNA metabolism and viral defense
MTTKEKIGLQEWVIRNVSDDTFLQTTATKLDVLYQASSENALRQDLEEIREELLFEVNTGCRDREIYNLRWDWEVKIPEINSFVFMVPGRIVKNDDERLIVQNRIALSVIDQQHGLHPTHVF